jgi:RNA recognition motif-containing protein
VRDAQVVMDFSTGRSKGFGFVEMNSDSEAQAAISGLNDQEHNGRPMMVNEARPREDRKVGGSKRW